MEHIELVSHLRIRGQDLVSANIRISNQDSEVLGESVEVDIPYRWRYSVIKTLRHLYLTTKSCTRRVWNK
jgi:hypothetical protein